MVCKSGQVELNNDLKPPDHRLWRVGEVVKLAALSRQYSLGSNPARVTIWLAPYPPAKIGKKEYFIWWYRIADIITGCQPVDRGSTPRITAI